jgi:hypothetical protein
MATGEGRMSAGHHENGDDNMQAAELTDLHRWRSKHRIGEMVSSRSLLQIQWSFSTCVSYSGIPIRSLGICQLDQEASRQISLS